MIEEYEESKDERATMERDMEALRIENFELRAEVCMHRHCHIGSNFQFRSSHRHSLPAVRQTGNSTGNRISANYLPPFPFPFFISSPLTPTHTTHTHNPRQNLALRHKLDGTASAEEEALILQARPVPMAGRDVPVLITTATAYHSFRDDNSNNGNNGPGLGDGPAHAARAAHAASAPPAYRDIIGPTHAADAVGDRVFAQQLRESEDARLARYARIRPDPETPFYDPSYDLNLTSI